MQNEFKHSFPQKCHKVFSFFLALNQLHEFVYYDINEIWGKSINQIKYLQIFQNNENVPSQNYDLPEKFKKQVNKQNFKKK